jgi:hypothetical protein
VKGDNAMSHWTRVKLKFTDKDVLAKALKRMGAPTVNTTKKKITQYGTTDEADIWVDNAVGFKLEKDGTFSMIGDFYHSTTPVFKKYYNQNKKFEEKLNECYGIEDAVAKIEGLQVNFNETGKVEDDTYVRLQYTSYDVR